jgi:metallo-beta-lactamase class B
MIQKSCETPWKLRAEPVKVAPHVYYGGNVWVGVYWIDTGEGIILLDSGMPQGLYIIFEGMRKFGFDPHDISLILLSHAHYDHCGAICAIKEYTGAVCYASKEDSAQLANPTEELLNFGYPFTGFSPDNFFSADKPIRLGNISVKPVLTPGHTPGTTSFFFEDVDETGTTYTVGVHGGLGLSPLRDENFQDSAKAWAKRDIYRKTQKSLCEYKVDIPLSFHPYNLGILDKNNSTDSGDWKRFIASERWLAMLEERLQALDELEESSCFKR